MKRTLGARNYLGSTERPWWSKLAHCTDRNPPKLLAKCLSMLCTPDWQELVIRNPLALCYNSHIGGGEHRPNSAVFGKTLCGACRPAIGDTKGQTQHL